MKHLEKFVTLIQAGMDQKEAGLMQLLRDADYENGGVAFIERVKDVIEEMSARGKAVPGMEKSQAQIRMAAEAIVAAFADLKFSELLIRYRKEKDDAEAETETPG